MALPESERPEDLDELLVRVAGRYDEDPNIAAAVSDLRVTLVGADEREQLVRPAITRWREGPPAATRS